MQMKKFALEIEIPTPSPKPQEPRDQALIVNKSETLEEPEDRSHSYDPYEPSDDRPQSRMEQADGLNII